MNMTIFKVVAIAVLLYAPSSLIEAFSMTRTTRLFRGHSLFMNTASIKSKDEVKHTAILSVSIASEATQKVFDQACVLFGEEVKTRGYKVPGFRAGAKLPAVYLFQMFGEENVKSLCSSLLANDIQVEAEKTGLALVGRGRILDFKALEFTPGKEHSFDVEVDLWPKILYGSTADGYKGLDVSVVKTDVDQEKYQKVKTSIKERYKVLAATPMGYAAKMGDVVVGSMNGFEKNSDGSPGASLPNIASGDSVEIFLEKGRFMDGMIEGLVGAIAGETKRVFVKFPIRPSGPGAALSGKEAVFEVKVNEIKTRTLPEWNEDLAARVRDGMTLSELEEEVRKALDGDQESSSENIRNEALAKVLLEKMTVSKLPTSLLDDTLQDRFQNMLIDFKEQGSTEEQLREMATPEKFERYKEISMPNAEKIVKLGLAFRDIAEKEGISISAVEIQEQLDVINMQAKQKGESPPDEANAKDHIENTLLRRKVFNYIASQAKITWTEAPVEQK
jgi:trigger factor